MSKKNSTTIQLRLPNTPLNDELDRYLYAYNEIKSFKSKQNLCIEILEKDLPRLIAERIRLESIIKDLD